MGIEDLAAGLDDLARNREALALLILHGEQAVPVLAEVLLGPPSSIPEARCLAAEGLGAVGGEAAVSALIRVLSLHDIRRLDPVLRLAEAAVRNRAAAQLGKLEDRRAVEPLLYALARDGVREAMAALAAFGEPRAIPHIVRRLEDPCDRAAASDALLLFGAAAVPALAATLTERWPAADDEAPVSVERRAEAARLLGLLGDRSAVAVLRAAVEDAAPPVRVEASLALAGLLGAEVSDDALDIVARGLVRASADLAARCSDALVAVGDCSIPALLGVTGPRAAPTPGPRRPGEDTLQVLAIEVLERIRTAGSLHALEAYLRDASPLVRGRARRALDRCSSTAQAHEGVGAAEDSRTADRSG